MYLALGKSELRLITDKEAPDPVHTKAALDYLQKPLSWMISVVDVVI